MLRVTVQDLDDAVILRCFGRIVGGEATAILCAAARHDGRNIVLDLKEVDGIDATGIGLLISLQAAGFYLKLANPTARVRETFTATQLDSVFEIYEYESLNGRTHPDSSQPLKGTSKQELHRHLDYARAYI